MGYTDYWIRSDKPLTEEFVEKVKAILWDCYVMGITICGEAGEGNPIVTTKEIVFNGSSENDLCHETFWLGNEAKWDFCKTAEKPYDYAVKRVLKEAEKAGIVTEWGHDGPTEMITDEEYVRRYKYGR